MTIIRTDILQIRTWHVPARWSNPEKQLHNHLWKDLPKHNEHLWQKLPGNVNRKCYST